MHKRFLIFVELWTKYSKRCYILFTEMLQNKCVYNKDKIIDTFKKWGRAYPNRGYGGRFAMWLFSYERNPYRSYGNGSAMRISPLDGMLIVNKK